MAFISVIIVAGGSGKRMGTKIPKQFLSLNGFPLLLHTLARFDEISEIDELILILPQKDLSWFENYLKKNSIKFKTRLKFVSGGKERQHSVKNGLDLLDLQSSVVLIHDGVRPFIKKDEILGLINDLNTFDAVIPGISIFETIKKCSLDKVVEKTISRDNLFLAQTPQVFKTRILKEAHKKAEKDENFATDDALILEQMGYRVKLRPGSRMNIKITTPDDFEFAEILSEKKEFLLKLI